MKEDHSLFEYAARLAASIVLNSEPLAYSPKHAAQALGIGLTALYSEIGAGRIKIRKFGTRTLIDADDLKTWLKSLPEDVDPGLVQKAQQLARNRLAGT